MSPRYLTKSRFKQGCECPTKLYYTKKEKEYANTSLEDPFLQALADGGFQVGELAKAYYPGGHDIKSLDYEESLTETNELLKLDEVVIFEPAFLYQNLFVRVDVLVKKGKSIELLEVKAKSFDKEDENYFIGKRGGIVSGVKPYLLDVSFQTHVVRSCLPDHTVIPYLFLVDKKQAAATDGLNQKFILKKNEKGRSECVVSDSLTQEDLKTKLLIKVPVDELVNRITNEEIGLAVEGKSFLDSIEFLATNYENDSKIPPVVASKCSKCEFNPKIDEGLKSGFKECLKESLNISASETPNILSVWNFRRKDKLIEEGKFFLKDVTEDEISPKPDNKAGISASERQWLQVEKAQNSDSTPYIDKGGLRAELSKLTYPLHFIDFETSMVPIPFYKGRKPYEGIAFQFSHHTLSEEGVVTHKNEFIDVNRGHYPNYDFLRELKKAVGDKGSIFRYATHENTYLNHIYSQMLDDEAVEDREELGAFIKEITTSKKDSIEKWQGPRNMIDLCAWVKRYYYDPATGGSNSIKQVLPAVLNSSKYIKAKYSKPIYGNEIKSLNFTDMAWIVEENGKVKDPYSLLPKLFSDVSDRDEALLMYESDELKDGGAALTAYAKLQFTEMSPAEEKELVKGLLRYCELDTLAMVIIFEAFREWVK